MLLTTSVVDANCELQYVQYELNVQDTVLLDRWTETTASTVTQTTASETTTELNITVSVPGPALTILVP